MEKNIDLLSEFYEQFPEMLNDIKALTSEDINTFYCFAIKKFYFNALFVVQAVEFESDGGLQIFSKSTKDLWAIYTLMLNGCLPQAVSIIRSLFETTVYTKYIFQDYHKRMDLFENYTHVELYYSLKKNKTTLPNKEDEQQITSNFEKVKSNYVGNKPWYFKAVLEDIKNHPIYKNHKFITPSFHTMCKLLGENYENMYKSLYSVSSNIIHGNSASLDGGWIIPTYDLKQMWLFKHITLSLTKDIWLCFLTHHIDKNPHNQKYIDYIEDEFNFYSQKPVRKQDSPYCHSDAPKFFEE